MKKQEWLTRQMGENLDALANIDPVCMGINRLWYPGLRDYEGGPVSTACAQALIDADLKENDVVLFLTGFVLRRPQRAEMDGFTGALLMARALVEAFGIKPVIVTPEISAPAAKACLSTVGLVYYDDMETVLDRPFAATVMSMPKDPAEAELKAEEILKLTNPKAMLSSEVATGNENGDYHMAYGWNVTEIEAKMDILFNKIKARGILTISVGDCGNELGVGVVKDYIKEHVPGAGVGGCICGCGGGVASGTAADHALVGRAADYGCYALIGALAYLKRNINIMHDGELQSDLMKMAARNGMVTTTGTLTPALDGLGIDYNVLLIDMIRKCVEIGINMEDEIWLDKYYKTGFLEKE